MVVYHDLQYPVFVSICQDDLNRILIEYSPGMDRQS